MATKRFETMTPRLRAAGSVASEGEPKRRRQRSSSSAALLAASLALAASASPAAQGDCGQPVSKGAAPNAADALAVLRAAVGQFACALWICDVDNSGAIKAVDALRVLRKAVGIPTTLTCPPEPVTTTSTSTTTTAPGSGLQCTASDGELTFKTATSETSAPLHGDLKLDCADPAQGGGACTCSLGTIDPIHLEGIGVVCVTETAQCEGGELDCAGASAGRVDLVSDHDIGACTSNASCATSCAAHCQSMSAVMVASGCEGFCALGANANAACTSNSGCPGSACNGKVNAHGQRCACHCRDDSQAASAGQLQCRLGLHLTLELAAPCDGADFLAVVGDQCMTLTSGSLAATLSHANAGAGSLSVAALEGQSLACENLAGSGTSGLALVGAVSMVDTLLGDLIATVEIPCD